MKKGIYAIICNSNGKMYIGHTFDFKTRKKTHWSKLGANKYLKGSEQLQLDWNQYGKSNFKFVIIEEIDTNSIDVMLRKEEDYIIRFGSFFEDKGYNVCLPVEKKFRKGFVEKYGEDFLRGLVVSNDDFLLREDWVSEKADLGRKVYQISKDNQIVKVWRSRKEIQEVMGVTEKYSRNIILNSNMGQSKVRKTWKNYIWVYGNNYNPTLDYSLFWIAKKKQLKEKVIKVYKSIEDYNIKRNPISLQNIVTQEVINFKSYSDVKKQLGFNVLPLVKGWKSKGGGKKVIITQWKGWKIYK